MVVRLVQDGLLELNVLIMNLDAGFDPVLNVFRVVCFGGLYEAIGTIPAASFGRLSTTLFNDASGMKTVKYGEVADWLLEVAAVLLSGEVITAGSKAAKTSSGYNLLDLPVESEGTLAVITRVALKLAGPAEQIWDGRAILVTPLMLSIQVLTLPRSN